MNIFASRVHLERAADQAQPIENIKNDECEFVIGIELIPSQCALVVYDFSKRLDSEEAMEFGVEQEEILTVDEIRRRSERFDHLLESFRYIISIQFIKHRDGRINKVLDNRGGRGVRDMLRDREV